VIRWLGDFIRLWWALFYWNTRKTWFRLRGAQRDDCPCQNCSDSGLALDTRCEAVVHWAHPGRFRRVCPLLVETSDGWRCSVEAEGVRPFWGRAACFFGGLLLALYLLGAVTVLTVLRSANYDVSLVTVVWPPQWHLLRAAREKLYADRAQQALTKGNFQEAMLALEMICEINPRNYSAGLALAGLAQVAAEPYVSSHIYERLMRDVPEKRIATAQIWFRTLLSRGAYDQIMPLAATMLSEDPIQRGPWLNALLFSARQAHDPQFLVATLEDNPHLPAWCTDLIGIEQDLLEDRPGTALPLLGQIHGQPVAPYVPYYQIDRLLLLGQPDRAGNLLNAYGPQVRPDEAAFLRLRIFVAKGWTSLIASEFDNLLQFPLSPRLASQFCAYLLSHPSPKLGRLYLDRFDQAELNLTVETVPLYQATYLVAIVANEPDRAEAIRGKIMKFTSSDAKVLRGLGSLLKANERDPRLSRILPLVPLPTEVLYAILERPPAEPTK
jgi:hypothetical protein